MKTFLAVGSCMVLAVSAWAAKPVVYQSGPKNLAAPTYRAPAPQAAVPHELTRKEVKRLIATAESAADHLKVADYYRAEAQTLDAKGAAYEAAATAYRNGPFVKSLMAPTTPGRYEFFAKEFREEATSDRAIAASHEQMAKDASAE